MNIIKTLLAVMLCLVMVISPAYASEPKNQQVGLVQYGESSFLLMVSNEKQIEITLYSLSDRRAVLQWTLVQEQSQLVFGFGLFPLPGILRIAHLTKNKLVMIAESGELIEQIDLAENDEWGNPVFAQNQSAVAFCNQDYRKLLIITAQGVETRDLKDSTVDTQSAFLDREGVVYQNWCDDKIIFSYDQTGECTSHATGAELAFVDELGFWTLERSTLRLPNGSSILLPDPNGQYIVSRNVPNGIILSDVAASRPEDPMDWGDDSPVNSLLVSIKDTAYGLWENHDVGDFHYLSVNMKYCLSEGDWIDDNPPSWDTWSRDSGSTSYSQQHRLLNKDSYIFDRAPVVFDDGRAVFLGEVDADESWQLWCLDLTDGTYSRIECI